MMVRNRGLSTVILLAITLGAGVNGALFLLLSNMLLRTPDLPHAESLVWLDDGRPLLGPTYPDYVDYRDRTQAFTDIAAYGGTEVAARLDDDERLRSLRAVVASGNYFATLQVSAAVGRTFGPGDDLPPFGTPVVVLSDAFWSRQFGRDPAVIGRTIDLNFTSFTVVGVLPATFKGARSPSGNPYLPDVWVPLWCLPQLEPADSRLTNRTAWWGLQAIGRLRDGVSIGQARAQIGTVARALDAQYPGARHARAPWVSRVTDFDTRVFRTDQGTAFAVLGTASLFVLIIACANAAGLLLARASARRREIAVRLSLGAGRGRIVRQFLGEGLVLSVTGTAMGLLAASWVLRAVVSSGGSQALAWSFWPDRWMVMFAAFLVVVVAVSTGLMPALQARKTALVPALTRSEPLRSGRLRAILIGTEVAVSFVLLLATALLVRGVVRAYAIDPGMPVDRLLTVSVDARLHGYQGAQLEAALDRLLREIEAVPGVTSTAFVNPAPFSGNRSGTRLRLADALDSPGVNLFLADVVPRFFETAGLQLVRGRWFDGRSPEEIVINQTLAARLWPDADPIGARVITGDFNRRSHVVVGIARDVPYAALRHQSEPFFFRQGRGETLLVRTAGPAASVTRAVLGATSRIDRRFAASVRPIADGVSEELQAQRAVIFAASGVGLLALLVALAGVGASAAQSVAQRTQEIGIRMALGARRRDAVTFIVRRALFPVTVGAAAGLAIGTQTSRVLGSILYGVSPLDPLAFAATLLLLMTAAAGAAWLPARRAATIDPVQALRSE
jgi:predicted permease